MIKLTLFSLALLSAAVLPLLAEDAKPAAPATPAAPAAPIVKDVTPDEAEKLLKENPKIVVLDVRTPEEYAKGHIAGAKNVDFLAGDVAKEVPKLDKTTPVLVHCAAGGRSGQALPLLKDQQIVYHLKDGYKAWEKSGKPVEK